MRTSLALFVLLAAAAPMSSHAQISPRVADAFVPVVGSTRGQSNANFRTELQLTNQTGTRMEGWLIFHPQGHPGSVTDAALRYELAAHATLSFPDILASLHSTGLGSLDVFVERGDIPTVVARAFDDQPAGTTGVTVPLVKFAAVHSRGDVAALIAPRDLTRFRFNIGVRSLDSGATLEITTRDSAGVQRHFRSVTYDATYFEQVPGDTFAGIALRPNDSLEIRFASGSAIVYATTVDNQTNDSAMQVLRR